MITLEQSYTEIRSETPFYLKLYFRHQNRIFAVDRLTIDHDNIGRSWFTVYIVQMGRIFETARIVSCGDATTESCEFLRLL